MKHIAAATTVLQPTRYQPQTTVAEQARELTVGAVQVLPQQELQTKLASGKPLTIKLGLDPTAPDIHLGHVVVLQALRRWQDAGHNVVVIIGDATAKVGDPSGRNNSRPMLDEADVLAAADTYQQQVAHFLDMDNVSVVRNSSWQNETVLLNAARHITAAQLLERDDFRKRLDEGIPISMLELMYPIMQAQDSVALDADVELGGTDQTHTFLLSRDLQRKSDQDGQVTITYPLLVGTDGKKKMSKSVGNTINVLDSPEDIYGKTMSVPDETMVAWYQHLLHQPPPADLQPMEQKRLLARTITDWMAGPGSHRTGEAAFDRTHRNKQAPTDIPMLTITDVDSDGNVHIPAVLEQAFGLSRSDGRRLLKQGAIKIDGQPLTVKDLNIPQAQLVGKVLQSGKLRFVRVSG